MSTNLGKMEKKIRSFEKELEAIKKRYGIDPVATLEFPQYRVLPDELLLALRIIEKHEYKIMLSYKEKENGN
jgi:hypothetical protein